MKNKKGFTLTEILLAVMIVGLIGVALASLTRAAAREAGVGRSKIMLRNHLSSFMRTLRMDLAGASYVSYVADAASCSSAQLLLRLHKNVDRTGAALLSTESKKTVVYCYKCSTASPTFGPVIPTGAYRGGTIYRYETNTYNSSLGCNSTAMGNTRVALSNVKFLPASSGFASPLFKRNPYAQDLSTNSMNSIINVQIVTELDSRPVMNEAIEETFVAPIGF